MRIACDIDGVLSAWVPAAVEAVNSLWPNRLPTDFEPTAWDWSPDITPEELKTASDKMHATPDCWYNLKPYTENVSALRSFLHRHPNTEVYYLTARWSSDENSALEQSTAWLKRQRLMSPRTSVIRVGRKESKPAVLSGLVVDAYIDDCAQTYIECMPVIANGESYLLERPWNIHTGIRHNANVPYMVRNLEDFLWRAGDNFKRKAGRSANA